MEKIKDFFLDFFKDPREEALSDQWNEHIRLINKAAKEREEKYKEEENNLDSMSDSQLLKQIAKNTLCIKKFLEKM